MAFDKIKNMFGYHKPSDYTRLQHENYRGVFIALARDIDALPDSREKSLALTALQESSMWAHAAIAMTDPVE